MTSSVKEVTIEGNAIGNSAAVLRESTLAAAMEKHGKLSSQFDHVIMCLPPGSSIYGRREWVGCAFLNHWLPIFNNLQWTCLSALMYKIGYNLGLSHSNADYDH